MTRFGLVWQGKKTYLSKKTMGNETNLENWAARERLIWVERHLWWQGWVGRNTLREIFGISPAQASSDLQKYSELNVGAMTYHTSRRRYESGARMRCVLHEPSLEEGLAFLEEAAGVSGSWTFGQRLAGGQEEKQARVTQVGLPRRGAKVEVERCLLLAALKGSEVTVQYHSLSEGEVEPRVIVPRAFGSDGRRWHVRAFDVQHEEWRDFVFGRFKKVSWPEGGEDLEGLPEDEDWVSFETVRLQVNPELSEKAQEAIRMDYEMSSDTMELRVRRSMKTYLLAELFLEEGKERTLPRHFVML